MNDKALIERLSLLVEELGETMQAIGKILRHGINNSHPVSRLENRACLEIELGHILVAIDLLCQNEDISMENILMVKEYKLTKINQYLHYNKILEKKTDDD